MKTYFKIALALTLFHIFCISQNSHAQNYRSVFAPQGSTTTWDISIFNRTCVLTYPFIIKDSVQLDGKYYKIVYNMAWQDTTYIREDIATGKVWARTSKLINNEKLLVDMSLNAGATFTFYYPVFADSLQATVSNVYSNNGRKVIEFDTNIVLASGHTQPLRFVEGIGREIGLLHTEGYNPWVSSCYQPILLCVHYDSLKVYQNSFPLNYWMGDSCIYEEISIPEHKIIGVTFNNPVNQFLKININEPFSGYCEIYNLFGNKVFNKEYSNTNEMIINTENWITGIYLVKLNDKNKKITPLKILKK